MKEIEKRYAYDFFDCTDENVLAVVGGFLKASKQAMVGELIRVTCLVNGEAFGDYSRTILGIKALFQQAFGEKMPALTFVSQAPLNGGTLGIETEYASGSERAAFAEWEGVAYVKVSGSGLERLYVGGIDAPHLPDAKSQSEAVFEKMDALLKREGYQWHQVVRQWNYIEAITEMEGDRQRYQAFNDVRAKYYGAADWKDGFPAATGIGMSRGGIVIDGLAAKPSGAERPVAYPLTNPLQIDAHRYSQDVLIGGADDAFGGRQTPKFERAKALDLGRSADVFVSGTAAIVGENTVPSDDPGEQTRITLDNIRALIGAENLASAGLRASQAGELLQLRVYVKNPQELPAIAPEVEKAYPGAVASFVHADVCREELLVEIEATAAVPLP